MDTETIHSIGEWMFLIPAYLGFACIAILLVLGGVYMIHEQWKDSKGHCFAVALFAIWFGIAALLKAY